MQTKLQSCIAHEPPDPKPSEWDTGAQRANTATPSQVQATMGSDISVSSSSSSNSSLNALMNRCSRSTAGILILTAFSITNIVVMLPVSVAVFYLGFRRCRDQCSTPTASATSSLGIFTYNMTAMVLTEVLGSVLYCADKYPSTSDIVSSLYDFFCTMWSMKMQFHVLTCVERYLAVVHPVTYLGLKNESGDRIRKISIGCIWLQFLLLLGLIPVTTANTNLVVFLSHLVFALVVICYCGAAVLCALSRPGPGEVVGDRSKQRAFHTIAAIMGTLLLSLGGVLVCSAIYVSSLLSYAASCATMMSFVWFSLPSSLVMPLLYLHRSGRPSNTQDKELD